MLKYTRRTAIQTALGTVVAANSSLTRAKSIAPFLVDWKEKFPNSREFTDVAQVDDRSFVVLTDPPTGDGDRPTQPQVTAYDRNGDTLWTWHWPDGSSQSPEYFQAVASTDDGGLILGGPADGQLLLTKLNTERNIEWKNTYEEWYGNMQVVQSSGSELLLIGTNTLPSLSETFLLGIEGNDGSVSWRNDSFADDYFALAACPHEDGYIVVGENPSGYGWLARLSTDGTIRWEQTYESPEINSLTDIMVTPSGLLIGIGFEYIDDGNNVRVIGLSADGSREWTTLLEINSEKYPTNPQIVSDPNGGYIICTSFGQQPELLIAATDESATIQNSSLLRPWNSELRLERAFASGGKFILAGELEGEQTGEYFTWTVGVERQAATPSPTSSPTKTAQPTTKPSTPTPEPTPTERETEESSSIETEEEQPESGRTQADGSGFGILASVVGVLGIGYLSRYYRETEND